MKKSDLRQYLATLKNPRIDRKKRHLVEDFFFTIAAVISGAEFWNDIELFGKQKKEWLSTFLSLPNGIPSQPDLMHDIRDSFRMLLPEEIAQYLDFGHGWIETRKCSVLSDLSLIEKPTIW